MQKWSETDYYLLFTWKKCRELTSIVSNDMAETPFPNAKLKIIILICVFLLEKIQKKVVSPNLAGFLERIKDGLSHKE